MRCVVLDDDIVCGAFLFHWIQERSKNTTRGPTVAPASYKQLRPLWHRRVVVHGANQSTQQITRT